MYIKKGIGTFIFPAALMSLAWFLYSFIPIFVLYDVPINPIPVLYINVCVSAFSLSALPFNWRYAYKANSLNKPSVSKIFDTRFIRILFYISSFAAILCSTYSILSNNFGLQAMIFNFMETSGKYAAMRGHGDLDYNIWGILSIFFTYLTPTLGGLVFRPYIKSTHKMLHYLISFFPSIYYMLTQSQKLVLFFSIGFFGASILLKKIYANEFKLFSLHSSIKILKILLITLPLILISFSTRQGFSNGLSTQEILTGTFFSLKSYVLAQIYAFSDYFSSVLGMGSKNVYINDFGAYGYYTFKSIFDFFGGNKYFPPGTFFDGYYYKNEMATNIYTIFRGLINDFGIIGTIFFMYLSGLIVHALFYHLLTTKKSWMACGNFIIIIVYIQGTVLFSIFTARYMYLLLLAFVFIFWINDKSKRINRLILTKNLHV